MPLAGAVMATTGVVPRFTVITELPLPIGLVQARVIVLTPTVGSATVTGLVVTETPIHRAGRARRERVSPLICQVTLVLESGVLKPLAGDVICGDGARPVTVVVTAGFEPNALVQTTLNVLLPATTEREFVLGVVVAEPSDGTGGACGQCAAAANCERDVHW